MVKSAEMETKDSNPSSNSLCSLIWMPLGNTESHLSLYSSYRLNNKPALVGNLSKRIILNSTGEGNRKSLQYLSPRTIMVIDILKKPKLRRKLC